MWCIVSVLYWCAHWPSTDPSVAMYLTPSPCQPPLKSFSPVATILLSISTCFVCLFVAFCFISHLCLKSYGSCLFLSHLFCLACYSQDPSMMSQMAVFHLFLWLSSIPLCRCTYDIIQSSTEGHVGCFHVLATMNNTVINIGVRTRSVQKKPSHC